MKLFALLPLFALLGYAQAPGPKPGRLEGKVVSSTGDPIRSAEIRLTPLSGGLQPSGQPYAAVTDANGAFVLENIAPHPRLGLTARKPGYQNFRYGSTSAAAPTVPIPIAEGEARTGMVLVMEQQGVFTGRVVSPEGDPIPNAIVIATNTSGAMTLPITGTTDDRGQFRIAGLKPGSYHLAAQSLLGNLDGAASKTTSMTTYYPSTTDRNAATALEVTEGQQTTGLEIRIVQSKGYTVRGTLTPPPSGGNTLISASLNQAQAGALANALASLNGASAILEKDGSFNLGPLAPGEYLVRATSISGGKTGIVGTAVVKVINADVAGVTLAPLRTFTVTGKVTFAEGTLNELTESAASMRAGKAKAKGNANAGLRFTLTPRGNAGSASAVSATAGEDGALKFEGVQPGVYTLTVPLIPQVYLKTLKWGTVDVTLTPLDIQSGGELELVLRKGAVRFSGKAKDADGKVPAGATALIWSVEPHPSHPGGGTRASSVDSEGAFGMPAIPPGVYYVAVFPGVNGVTVLQPRFHERFKDVAVKIEIHENMPLTFDLVSFTTEQVQKALKEMQ